MAVKLVMNRNATVRTGDGCYAYQFEKDVPMHVAPGAIGACLRVGAQVAEGEVEHAPDQYAKPAPPPAGDVRTDKIMEAIASLVARNGRDDFTATGLPQLDALHSLSGVKVDGKERNKLWQRFHAEQAKLLEAE